MSELYLHVARMSPWQWTGSKVVLAALVTLVAVAGRTTTGRDPYHRWLMLAGYLGLVVLFAYGIVTRGVMGSVGAAPHGFGFFVFFVPHVSAGLFFLVVGLWQLVSMLGGPSAAARSDARLRRHRVRGHWLGRAVLILGVFGLAL